MADILSICTKLEETTVLPLRVSELLDDLSEFERLIANKLSYPESEGSKLLRERIAQFYLGCKPKNITVTNGSSEENYVTLWTLLEPGSRPGLHDPNYMQAWGLGRTCAEGVDAFLLVKQKEDDQYRWTLDIESLKPAVTSKTNVMLIINPNNSTRAVLTATEMDVVVELAAKAGAWLVVDEVYHGAEVQGGKTPSFWGRYEKVDIFTYVCPEAGAFVYCEYNLLINLTELVNRLRLEQSVLVTAGDQHGLDKGIYIGFGYDVEKTLKGLARLETLIRSLK